MKGYKYLHKIRRKEINPFRNKYFSILVFIVITKLPIALYDEIFGDNSILEKQYIEWLSSYKAFDGKDSIVKKLDYNNRDYLFKFYLHSGNEGYNKSTVFVAAIFDLYLSDSFITKFRNTYKYRGTWGTSLNKFRYDGRKNILNSIASEYYGVSSDYEQKVFYEAVNISLCIQEIRETFKEHDITDVFIKSMKKIDVDHSTNNDFLNKFKAELDEMISRRRVDYIYEEYSLK